MTDKITGVYIFDEEGRLMVRLLPYNFSTWVACPVFDGNPPCRGLGCLAGVVNGNLFGCVWLDRQPIKIQTEGVMA
jgi:hypothetical protein